MFFLFLYQCTHVIVMWVLKLKFCIINSKTENIQNRHDSENFLFFVCECVSSKG